MKRKPREPIVLAQMRPFTLFLVLCGCIAVTFGFIHITAVASWLKKLISALGPVLTGAVFAYLLNPAMELLERRFAKWMKKPVAKHPKLAHLPRIFAALITVLLFAGSLALLLISVFSQVVDGISTFMDKLPEYIDNITAWAERLMHSNSSLSGYIDQLAARFSAAELDTVDVTQKILSLAASGAAGTFGIIYNLIVGIIITVYLLISKERFLRQWKQVLYAIASPRIANRIDSALTNANEVFGTAILGKMVDSLLIGAICFMFNTIMHMPYATLIAVIVGVTNMIPYFGPIFGAIPCVLLLLMESPAKALTFAIFIVILQQIDANLLDPRIVGHSIGLPAFWELFACLLGGGLFGVLGLVLGVPIFALVYQLIRQAVGDKLRERGQRSQLSAEFLTGTLGISDLEDAEQTQQEQDSPYLQRFIQLDNLDDES